MLSCHSGGRKLSRKARVLFSIFILSVERQWGYSGSQTLVSIRSPREPIKYLLQGKYPRVSKSVGLGCDLSICISNELPADTTGPGPPLENYWYNG